LGGLGTRPHYLLTLTYQFQVRCSPWTGTEWYTYCKSVRLGHNTENKNRVRERVHTLFTDTVTRHLDLFSVHFPDPVTFTNCKILHLIVWPPFLLVSYTFSYSSKQSCELTLRIVEMEHKKRNKVQKQYSFDGVLL